MIPHGLVLGDQVNGTEATRAASQQALLDTFFAAGWEVGRDLELARMTGAGLVAFESLDDREKTQIHRESRSPGTNRSPTGRVGRPRPEASEQPRARHPAAERRQAWQEESDVVSSAVEVGFERGGFGSRGVPMRKSTSNLSSEQDDELERLRDRVAVLEGEELERRRTEIALRQARAELERTNQTLRDLQGRLIEAERLEAAEEFAASVAHAINNPLAALIGNLQLQIDATREPDARLERSLHLAKRIRAVVERTLRLYRGGALKRAPTAAEAVLADVSDELAERAAARNIRLELKVEAGLPLVEVDRALLAAALVSIAENSLDAMRDGGTLGLIAEALPGTNVVAFRVWDTGPGIPEPLREEAFKAFFTTKGGGTGLGLAIARGIVRGHTGRISISDRPGGGALISAEIPAVPEARQSN